MSRRRRAISGVIVASTLVCALPALAQKTLSIVADEWPPFSGQALPNKGISVDVISAVLIRAGYEVESKILPWARIMNGSRTG